MALYSRLKDWFGPQDQDLQFAFHSGYRQSMYLLVVSCILSRQYEAYNSAHRQI